MSKAIPLSNLEQEHLGFMLLADFPDDYHRTIGQWEGDCVFIALPKEAHLFTAPSYLTLAEHDHWGLGEHRVTIINDGEKVSYSAVGSDTSVVYVSIPLSGVGEWGIIESGLATKLGRAEFSEPRLSKG